MDSSPEEGFEITTAIRNDKLLINQQGDSSSPRTPQKDELYMPHLHRDRMLLAVEAFSWPQAALEALSSLDEHLLGHLRYKGDYRYSCPLKLRVSLSYDGTMHVTSMPTPDVELECLFPKSLSGLVRHTIPSFHILVSPVTSTPTPFTSHKTTNRKHYDEIRAMLPRLSRSITQKRAHLLAEILLVNQAADIMEGSITTPYFLREGKWITPAADSGGNLGTTRRYALEQGLCKEGIISKESVQVGEQVVLSNGVRGFGWGVVEKLEASK